MKSATTLAWTMAFLFLLGMQQGKLLASTIAEAEPDDTIATAQNVDAGFSVVSDPNVFQSATVPHVTIQGTGNGTFDYYSFTVTAAGVLGTFDMDNTNFDTELFLYDTAGNLLAANDDNGGDPGSVGAPFDSLIQDFSFSGPGTFVIGVGRYPSSGGFGGITGSTPFTGAFYDLHISLAPPPVSADLQITKTDAPDPAIEGQNITYTVTITNNGPSDAASVQFDDTIPLSTTFQSITPAAGWTQVSLPPVGGNGTITYTRPTLTVADGPQVFTIVVKVNFGAATGSPTSNTATVSSTTTDPNSTNNSATANTTIGGVGGGLKVRGAIYSVNFTRRSQGAGPNVDNFEFQGKVSLDDLVTAGVNLRNLAAAPVNASLAGVGLGLALPVITRPRLVVWRTAGGPGVTPFLQVTFNPVSGAYRVLVRGVDLDGAVGFPTGGAASMISLSAALTIGPWSDSALLKTTYRMFQGANTIGWGNFHFGQAAFDLPNGIFFVERARILQRKIGGVLMQRALVTVCFLPPDGVASDPSGGVGAMLNLGTFSEDVGGAGAPANFVANPAGNMFTYRRPLAAGRTGVARMVIDLRRWKMTALTHWMPAAASPFGIAPVLNPATDPRGSVVFAVGMSLTATYNASVLTGRARVNFLSGNLNALP